MPSAEPRVSYLIARLDRAVRGAINERVQPHGLTVSMYTTLSVLKARSGLSNAQLARRAYVTPQSMNEVIRALEGQGLVSRSPDPDHGRVLRTELTAAGVRTLEQCDREVDALEARMLDGFTEAGSDRLLTGIARCVERLETLD